MTLVVRMRVGFVGFMLLAFFLAGCGSGGDCDDLNSARDDPGEDREGVFGDGAWV